MSQGSLGPTVEEMKVSRPHVKGIHGVFVPWWFANQIDAEIGD